jgi:hypothetical protein
MARRIGMRLKIAQPVMAGVLAPGHHPKSRPGTRNFRQYRVFFRPGRDLVGGLNANPAINGWAIFAASPSAPSARHICRTKTKMKPSPGGAA